MGNSDNYKTDGAMDYPQTWLFFFFFSKILLPNQEGHTAIKYEGHYRDARLILSTRLNLVLRKLGLKFCYPNIFRKSFPINFLFFSFSFFFFFYGGRKGGWRN